MTGKEIEKTLDRLLLVIEYHQHVDGNDDRIRVRMGKELAERIKRHYIDWVIDNADYTGNETIFGYPLEIDDANPMCLEVLTVERVPVYRESEA